MAEAIARAVGVTKRFGETGPPALNSVDMDIAAGHMTGLVGPDGAGKTTLIRLLAGLIDPDEGEVSVLGCPAVSTDRSAIGYMPQRFGLYEDLSVLENLRLYADLRGLDPALREDVLERLLEFTDLGRFQARHAGQLSGGMKQKLGLACALVRTPKLLLLDEPGVGVDPVARRELWAMVQELAGEGMGVLWSTAYLDEAEKCDTVFLLNEGQLLFSGPPDRLTARVDGRTFRLALPQEERRPLLERITAKAEITDAIIQGSAIRFLTAQHAPPEAAALGASSSERIESVSPRFEDAFIDVLGGAPGGASPLAQHYRWVPETDQPAIEARGLTKTFGAFTAAKDITFSVPRGQIFGLLGPNGAGKSTTFKMLCGLLTPTSGEGKVAGHDLRTARADARQSLGYMAQKFSLYGDLSVQQNLDFFGGVYGLNRSARREAIDRAIEIFELERYLTTNAGTLPLGLKQRLALACAVLHEPPVLFLDEPTSGVDPVTRREFWGHINGLVQRGVTVLVTTHFMEEAEYCDRIALIYRAREIAIGTPDDLKARATTLTSLADPTMEDAFIALIKACEQEVEAA
ncbi:ATP-binding cassette domain-containing protein [Pedomonas mirosovicensis]|uniref:ATP-binding cassette domain-containing protein n=1 Tax=Pedomonas mirosovicensis TaxID=2908641 RepID=UPI0021692464|nr:ATP-binding cassette domain-containing protein [Pedomonas mirosovicensis]MCH8686681.1 ATP-binding cassette domain-containing protein [Pedomonas mirosovicensis]